MKPLSKRPETGFQDQLSLNAGRKYCRMLPLEHSAILLTFIKLPFVIKIFVIAPLWVIFHSVIPSIIPSVGPSLSVCPSVIISFPLNILRTNCISRGHRLKFPNEIVFLSLKIAFISVDYAAFRTHLEVTSIQRINFTQMFSKIFLTESMAFIKTLSSCQNL